MGRFCVRRSPAAIVGATALAVASLATRSFPMVAPAAQAAALSPLVYQFSVSGVVEETGSMGASPSPYWWVNSGGWLNLHDGRGWTVQGGLPIGSPWQLAYAAANPLDTDGGIHPQNIFRLVSKSRWQNFSQETYFRLKRLNLSASPNRDRHNGVLLFNRYVDSQNLYYLGMRVDGYAVIKKKINGKYFTIVMKPWYPGAGSYNRTSQPNLLPLDTWVGLRSVVTTNADGSVQLKLYEDRSWKGAWREVFNVRDDGRTWGPVISQAGFGGMRTDFADVEFDQWKMTAL